MAFIRPQAEAYVDQFLTRDRGDVDAAIIGMLDVLARHLSDDIEPFAVGPRGADLAALIAGYVDHDHDQGEQLDGLGPGDPLRAPDPAGGGDAHGEVAPGPEAVPVGSGPAAGDRPG
jgi:hypothetical protein